MISKSLIIATRATFFEVVYIIFSIETVIGKIKFPEKFELSKHRSVPNAFVHMMASLINYQALDHKPSIVSLLT
jgi:hypothetical protein